MNPGRKILIAATAMLVTIIGCLLLAELGLRVAVGLDRLKMPLPPTAAQRAYYDGRHPELGVWRYPNAELNFEFPCGAANYATNSVGARDAERRPGAAGPRAVMLGDSFMAGFGLPMSSRLSEQLDKETGVEHLNFAMSHFSPYQSYLAYRHIAKDFEHDLVLIGILPTNDFNDLDYNVAMKSSAYAFRYRPYLVGEYPDYEQIAVREPALRYFLRQNFYLFTIVDLLLHPAVPGEGYMVPTENHLGLKYSYFDEFSGRQFRLLQKSLELLAEEADGRPVVAFLVPAAIDFVRYRQSGQGKLLRRLEAERSLRGITFIDLTPDMYQAVNGRIEQFFFSCDYHWNAFANQTAAKLLSSQLRRHYRRLSAP